VSPAQAVAGVDLGGTKIEVAVFDEQYEALGQARHPTPGDKGPQAVAQAIVEATQEACEAALSGDADESLAHEVRNWFQSWMELGWFCRRE